MYYYSKFRGATGRHGRSIKGFLVQVLKTQRAIKRRKMRAEISKITTKPRYIAKRFSGGRRCSGSTRSWR